MQQKLDIHKDIYDKLEYFFKVKKIPNIIFHGESGCGKRTIVDDFIKLVYNNDKSLMDKHVMIINCAHGKGIKFIREKLKFFAKTNINYKTGYFKSIVLLNADKLTIDAQSALRRCIELFSYSTRFFMIVENKYNLLNPILSRFVEIFVPLTMIDGKFINLKQYNINQVFDFSKEEKARFIWLKNQMNKLKNNKDYSKLCDFSETLYEKGYSGLDLINYIEKIVPDDEKKYQILITINKVKSDFIHEKMLILFILNFLFIRSDYNLENITFM